MRKTTLKVFIIKEVFKSVPRTKQQKNASYRNGSSAFTLLETILSITIILSISSLIPLFFECYNKTIQLSNIDQTTEWQLFLIQTRLELEKASNIQVNGNILSFHNGKDLITYSKYNDLIRRQVNGKGHEPLLTNVKDYQLIKKEHQLLLKIQDVQTKTYTSVFPLPEAKQLP
ncbi:ComGF family competence protein [Listeria sp. FSL L7-1434]|nr:ComGF family competence protein [Listeria cossartiae subsp. cossartiae]